MFSNSGLLGPASLQARNPRGIVLINDKPIKWENIEVTTTTFYLADSFRIDIPMSIQLPPFTFNYWASTPQLTVKVYMGFPSNPDVYSTQDLELMIVGDADEIDIDPLSQMISLSGRDYTARFIDTKTTEKFPGKTSSYIITQFAKEQGLTPEVTETKTIVGTFYDSQQTLLSREVTKWDLMTFLAQQENFVLFVRKDRLVFEPRPDNPSNPYILNYQPPTILQASPGFNGMSLSIARYLTLAKDVKVTIKVPYSSKTGQSFYVTRTGNHRQRSSESASVNVQKYSYVIPGLTPEQAGQKAEQLIRDITLHEINISASLPGDNVLQKDSMIKLTGTGTIADQLYFVDNCVRNMSIPSGYNMTISAKNHSVDSEVSL